MASSPPAGRKHRRAQPSRKERRITASARRVLIENQMLPKPGASLEDSSREPGHDMVMAEVGASERQWYVANLVVEGFNYYQIGKELGISISAVHHDVVRCIEIWQEHTVDKISQWITLELVRIAKVESEAWDAFRRSQVILPDRLKDRYRARTILLDGVKAAGDWHFLDMALKAGVERRKLLGLDAPELRIEEHNYNVDLGLDERTERIAELLDAARARRARRVGDSESTDGSGSGLEPDDLDRAQLQDSGDPGQEAAFVPLSESVSA